jgi:hypothetical protein
VGRLRKWTQSSLPQASEAASVGTHEASDQAGRFSGLLPGRFQRRRLGAPIARKRGKREADWIVPLALAARTQPLGASRVLLFP